jgi:hypothetical protein
VVYATLPVKSNRVDTAFLPESLHASCLMYMQWQAPCDSVLNGLLQAIASMNNTNCGSSEKYARILLPLLSFPLFCLALVRFTL